MDLSQPPPDEVGQEPRDRERSSVLASPAFWLAALGSLAFWVVIAMMVIG